MNSWDRMSEEKRILAHQCHRLWMPVFFGSLILVYGPLAVILSDGSEGMSLILAIAAAVLACLTAPVVDAIYYEIRDHFIMKRYRQGKAEEDAMND